MLLCLSSHRGWVLRYGWKVVAYESPNRMGLINLNGRVIGPTTQPDVAGKAECRR
jgi:hypothetical protein